MLEKQGTVTLKTVAGDVELCDVSFRYKGSVSWVLKDISLRVHAGQTVALVGPSGGGKTTLAKLLLRLYDPVQGKTLTSLLPPLFCGRALGSVSDFTQLGEMTTLHQHMKISSLKCFLLTFVRCVETDCLYGVENTGSIKIDGHDIRECSLKSLRQQVAIVPQETVLSPFSCLYFLHSSSLLSRNGALV